MSELEKLQAACKALIDTLPSCSEAYYSHWDAGSEETEEAIEELKKLLPKEKIVPEEIACTKHGWSNPCPYCNEPDRPVRVMAMCEGGHNRSGALALQLKQRAVDAVQIGWRFNTAETINYFAEWADFIILAQPWGPETTKIDEKYQHKIRVLDLGPDVWGSNTNMALNQIVAPFVESWIERKWDI